MGAKTAVAFGGEMALRLLRLFQPAVVLVDLRMPGLDGCEVMAQARALPECGSATMFVCLSASREAEDEQRCLGAGFQHFVHKPVDPSDLARILSAAQARVHRAGRDQQQASAEVERPTRRSPPRGDRWQQGGAGTGNPG